MIELINRVALEATALLIVFLALLFAPVLRAEATIVKDLRIGDNNGYVRMVLEFDRPVNEPPSISIEHNRLQVTLAGIVNTFPPPRINPNQSGIIRLDVTKPEKETRIDAHYSFTPADIKTFALTGPHRFIVDAYRPLPSEVISLPSERGKPANPEETSRAMPEPYHVPELSTAAGISNGIVEASLDAYDALAAERFDMNQTDSSRFKQKLIVALIVVTTVIVVLLFFLIWVTSNGNAAKGRSWRDNLPPANDQSIESIDSVIREHLKTYDDI